MKARPMNLRFARPTNLFLVGAAISAWVFALAVRPAEADETDVWSRSTPLPITLTSYEFAPAHINLQHGKAYRLHLVNTSGKGHDFSAPELFAASTIAPADRTKIDDGSVEVDSGSSVDISLVPATPGDYAVRCTHFLHAMFGMRATVTVN
jgi:uncharacterized cupredoxin-like copper-binding protein